MARELAQLTKVEGGQTIVLSALEPTDAELHGKGVTFIQNLANTSQYVPHALDYADVTDLFDPYNPDHTSRTAHVIETTLNNHLGGVVVVAEQEETYAQQVALMGVCFAHRTPTDKGTGVYIQELAVDPDEQGKGIGSLLMKTAIDMLAPADDVALDAMSCNPTVDWYGRLGFTDAIDGAVCSYVDEPFDLARSFHMTRSLDGLTDLLSARTEPHLRPITTNVTA